MRGGQQGTVPGQGGGGGRRTVRGGGGRGIGGGTGQGPGGYCICPNCMYREPHKVLVPCYNLKCPRCGTLMSRG